MKTNNIILLLMSAAFLSGNLVYAQGDFQKEYISGQNNYLYSAVEADNGCCLLLGRIKDDGENAKETGYVLKIDAKGDTVSVNHFSFPDHDFRPVKLCKLQTGKYVFGAIRGYTYAVYLYCVDENGKKLWNKQITDKNYEELKLIRVAGKNEIILLTEFEAREGFNFTTLYKCGGNGRPYFTANLSDIPRSMNMTGMGINDLIKTSDGNFLLTGFMKNGKDDVVFCTTKISPKGQPLWIKDRGFENYISGEGQSVTEHPQNEYVIFSYVSQEYSSDINFTKYSASGERLSEKSFPLPTKDFPGFIIPYKPGYYFVSLTQESYPDQKNTYAIMDGQYNILAETGIGQKDSDIKTTAVFLTSDGALFIAGYIHNKTDYVNKGFVIKTTALNTAFENNLKILKNKQ